MKKVLLIAFVLVLAIITAACGNSTSDVGNNSTEVWKSDKFLSQFENFEHEIKFFIEWNNAPSPKPQDLEESVNKMINEKYLDCLWAVWKTYLLETEIGTKIEFYELEGIDVVYNVYLIPRETVKNTIMQLYNIKENEIKFDEWENFDTVNYENPKYFKLIIAFGGRLVSTEILYDTLSYSPVDNMVTFDLQYYIPEEEKIPEFELVRMRYTFQPFMYKDKIQQYKFMSVKRVS